MEKRITNSKPKLLIKKLHQDAIVPKQGSTGSAGYDLYSVEEKTIPAKGLKVVKTGIAIKIPHGNYGRIGNKQLFFIEFSAPRSGLAAKWCIDVGAGVIDEDYRGQSYSSIFFINFLVGVILFNHGVDTFYVKKGDRIA